MHVCVCLIDLILGKGTLGEGSNLFLYEYACFCFNQYCKQRLYLFKILAPVS